MAFHLGIPIQIFSFNGSNSSTCKFQITRKHQTTYKVCHPHLLYSKTHFSVSMKMSKVLASNHYFQNFWLNLPKGLNFSVFPTVLIKAKYSLCPNTLDPTAKISSVP